jgi:hypothetical protein
MLMGILVNVCSFFSLVDALTVIPTWATLGVKTPTYGEIDNGHSAAMYVLNLFKTTRVLRPLRIRRKLLNIEDEVQRTLADMTLRIVIMILFSKFLGRSCFLLSTS